MNYYSLYFSEINRGFFKKIFYLFFITTLFCSYNSFGQTTFVAKFNNGEIIPGQTIPYSVGQSLEVTAIYNMGTMPDLKTRIQVGTVMASSFDTSPEVFRCECNLIPPSDICMPDTCQIIPTNGYILNSFQNDITNPSAGIGNDSASIAWTPVIPGMYRIEFYNEFFGFPTFNPSATPLFTFFIEVTVPATVPTMTQWSTFLFFLIMLGMGLVVLYNFQYKIADNMGNAISAPRFQLPFEMEGFKWALKHALGLSLIGFTIIYIGWGEVTGLDVFGMTLSVALLAYLIHLIPFFKNA